MATRGPKVKFSRTRDAAAMFLATRGPLGYRRAMRDASALFGVPERNIERQLDPATTLLSAEFAPPLALCAIAANKNLIRANLRGDVSIDLDGWPEPLRAAITQLLPGT